MQLIFVPILWSHLSDSRPRYFGQFSYTFHVSDNLDIAVASTDCIVSYTIWRTPYRFHDRMQEVRDALIVYWLA